MKPAFASIKPAIIEVPASNCEKDMEKVISEVFGISPYLLWHTDEAFPHDVSHVILPGGFAFGDYLRAGALATKSPIMQVVKDWALRGGPTLGICNGFQILCEAGLLPGILLKNHHDRFVCQLETITWFRKRKIKKIRLPIAHREGRYFADDETLNRLFQNGQIAFTYDAADEDGNAKVNGSKRCIAGLIGGPAHNILGLMPHPERMVHEDMLGSDGLAILKEFFLGEGHEETVADKF
jgi:phosphoribosylformylglycinamidine synthase subunit PurQ / glutaminase